LSIVPAPSVIALRGFVARGYGKPTMATLAVGYVEPSAAHRC